MIKDSKQLLVEQWQTLHNSHESYENYAIIIKLVAIVLTLLALTLSVGTVVTLLLLATLWLQEGIWKTFQQRTESAIIAIEDKLNLNDNEQSNESTMPYIAPYLFYKQWQANRPSTKGLICEYISNSLKPTVLYPYFPLMFVVVIF